MDHNQLCGLYYVKGELQGTYTAEGITALCDALKGSVITSLRCAFTPRVFAFPSMPVDTCLLSYCPHPSLCSLGYNDIGAEGASALAAILKETQITQLKCARTGTRPCGPLWREVT